MLVGSDASEAGNFPCNILGFYADLIAQHYDERKEKEQKALTIRQELGGEIEDAGKVDGLLLLKRQEVKKKQQLFDVFDFRSQDKADSKQLVDEIDDWIARLNQRRYLLNQNRKKVITSFEEDQILLNPEDATQLFRESGVLFAGQIKRDLRAHHQHFHARVGHPAETVIMS